jgi:acyl carrier protein
MPSQLQEKELVAFITGSLIKKGGASKVTPDTLLFKQHILDSMNILDLIGYVEKKTGRRLKDEEIIMTNFQSARAIIKAFSNE